MIAIVCFKMQLLHVIVILIICVTVIVQYS